MKHLLALLVMMTVMSCNNPQNPTFAPLDYPETKKVDTKDLVKFTLFRQAKKHLNLETKEKKSN